MFSLWIFLLVLVLTIGFVGLLMYESRQGRRIVFEERRGVLDTRVVHAGIVLRSIEYGPLIRGWARRATNTALHELSAAVLFIVRFLERMLTKFVKRMYRVRTQDAAKGNGSPFIEAIKEAKKEADNEHKNGNPS